MTRQTGLVDECEIPELPRAAALTVAAGLALAACTSRPTQRPPPPQRPVTMPVAAHPLPTTLHQQTGPRFVKGRNGPSPIAITILTSSRSLRPRQHGVVLTVRGVGNLIGSCRSERPVATFRLTYRGQRWWARARRTSRFARLRGAANDVPPLSSGLAG